MEGVLHSGEGSLEEQRNMSIDIDTTVQEEDGSIGERSFAVEMVLYNVPEQSKHVEEKHESVCGWSGY